MKCLTGTTFMFFCLALIIVFTASSLPAQAVNEKELRQALELFLREKIMERVVEHLGDASELVEKGLGNALINFNQKTGTIAFSPVFLRLSATEAQKRLPNFKRLQVDPVENMLHFAMQFEDGSEVNMAFLPEFIELGENDFSIVGRLPEGVSYTQPETAAKGLSAYLDAFLGVSDKLSQLMQSVQIDGQQVSLQRPFKASVLSRALEPVEDLDGVRGRIPFFMENGWLKLSLKGVSSNKDLWQMALNILISRLQK